MGTEKIYTKEELTGTAPATWKVLLSTVGLIAIAVGTMLPILNVNSAPGTAGTWWKYVYASGAACYLLGKLLSPYDGSHPRIKRLYRIESWSAIFFCVAAFFIFYNGNVTRDAWAFTLAGGALLIFTSIAIPATANKELKRAAENRKTKKKE